MATDHPTFNDPDQHETWLTVYEVAGQLLARPDTIQRWVRQGLLPVRDRGRLGLRIPKSAVDEFIIKKLQMTEGFRAADHSLSSGVTDDVLTATELPEQSLARQGAGWPFRGDGGEQQNHEAGHSFRPGGL